jgi:predicted dehydrogenase
MRRGIHVLVEKPLASNESDIAQLLAVAHETKQILCTGHVERFNSKAVSVCQGDIVEFRRVSSGSYDGRHAVLDLLVHDLDLLAYWLDLSADETMQVTASRLDDREVEATCLMAGVPVCLRAGYGAPTSHATVLCGAASPVADMLTRSPRLSEQSGLYGQDPLTRQYSAFRDRLSGLESPIADGTAGSAAARRALAILRAL